MVILQQKMIVTIQNWPGPLSWFRVVCWLSWYIFVGNFQGQCAPGVRWELGTSWIVNMGLSGQWTFVRWVKICATRSSYSWNKLAPVMKFHPEAEHSPNLMVDQCYSWLVLLRLPWFEKVNVTCFWLHIQRETHQFLARGAGREMRLAVLHPFGAFPSYKPPEDFQR